MLEILNVEVELLKETVLNDEEDLMIPEVVDLVEAVVSVTETVVSAVDMGVVEVGLLSEVSLDTVIGKLELEAIDVVTTTSEVIEANVMVDKHEALVRERGLRGPGLHVPAFATGSAQARIATIRGSNIAKLKLLRKDERE